MLKEIWNKYRAGIANINFYSDKGIHFFSITGFRYGKYIISDPSAYMVSKAQYVEISFGGNDIQKEKSTIRFSLKEFKQNIIKSIKENASFVLIKIEQLNDLPVPSLPLAKERNYQVGTPIVVIGYQLDQRVMAMKSGMISTFFKTNNVPFIQYEASVNQGNSGSPLFNLDTGEVIGITGYRLAMINAQHVKLMKIINTNLEQIKKLEGKYKYENIDVSQILSVTQNQIKHLAHEFNRQSSFQYGFALEICKMKDLFPSD
jgi:hypothetical protein